MCKKNQLILEGGKYTYYEKDGMIYCDRCGES